MTVEAPRTRGRWSAGNVPDAPGFRRRQRLLAVLLALHLPGLAGLAVLTGGEPHEILVPGAVVVLAIAIGAFLDISPRLRALALTGGLLWCSAVVGMLTSSVIPGALHAAAFGLVAAAHLGASWRSPRAAQVEEATTPSVGELAAPEGQVDAPPQPAGSREGLVEVQEIYTGVWSAKHLVRPTTRLVPLEHEPAGEAAVAEAATGLDEPRIDVDERPAGADGAPGEVESGADDASVPAADEPVAPQAPAAARDHDLTREVLEALHLSTVEPSSTGPAPEHATSGAARR